MLRWSVIKYVLLSLLWNDSKPFLVKGKEHSVHISGEKRLSVLI